MNENKSFEFLSEEEKAKMDEALKGIENIALPESLSPEKIEELIKDVPQLEAKVSEEKPKKKRNKKKIALRAISAAAAVVIAMASVIIVSREKTPPPVAQQSVTGDAPAKAENYEEIEELFAEYAKNYKNHYRYNVYNGIVDFAISDEASAEIADDVATQNMSQAPTSTGSGNKNYSASVTSPQEESAQEHGETNEQVQGVSEADIIKNDGKYLYVVNPDNADWSGYYRELEKFAVADGGKELTTVAPGNSQSTPPYNPAENAENGEAPETKAEGKKAEKPPVLEYDCSISVIEPDENGGLTKKAVINIAKPESTDIFYTDVQEIYVKGNRLIAILNCREYLEEESTEEKTGYSRSYSYAYYGRNEVSTLAVSFDLSNLSAIKEEWRIYQDGGYISSRLIGDELVLLSSFYVDITKDVDSVKNGCIPEMAVDNEEPSRISSNDICIMDEVRDSRYLVASVMDVKNKSTVKTQAVLGGGENVYCTTETLYVTSNDYGETDSVKEIFGVESGELTQIYKFDIRNYDIKYLKNASVNGSALNQFSIDEFDGFLRIATTLGNWGDGLVNQLYVLDENLETKGLLKDIAKGERIKSVRFSGETAYVVTFIQTDPLFVIDLSKPSEPKISGELKIPGYSAYLHPVGDGLVMGVGLDGTNSGTNGGIKISLFDVSDGRNPKECGKFVMSVNNNSYNLYEYFDCPALNSHKALCWDNESKIMYIPYTKTSEYVVRVDDYYSETVEKTGVIALKVDEKKKELTLAADYSTGERKNSEAQTSFSRATYIGSNVFAFSERSGELASFNKETAEVRAIIKTGE